MVLSPLVLVLRGLGIGIGIEGQNFDSIGIGIGIEGPSIDFWYWYWYWYCNPWIAQLGVRNARSVTGLITSRQCARAVHPRLVIAICEAQAKAPKRTSLELLLMR